MVHPNDHANHPLGSSVRSIARNALTKAGFPGRCVSAVEKRLAGSVRNYFRQMKDTNDVERRKMLMLRAVDGGLRAAKNDHPSWFRTIEPMFPNTAAQITQNLLGNWDRLLVLYGKAPPPIPKAPLEEYTITTTCNGEVKSVQFMGASILDAAREARRRLRVIIRTLPESGEAMVVLSKDDAEIGRLVRVAGEPVRPALDMLPAEHTA